MIVERQAFYTYFFNIDQWLALPGMRILIDEL